MEHLNIGRIGEEIDANFLETIHCTILETNWRYKKAEIDIIAMSEDNTLLFVEVKTRSNSYFGPGSDSIDLHKRNLIIDAAMVYWTLIQHKGEIRFDVVDIFLRSSEEFRMEYTPNAFFDEF